MKKALFIAVSILAAAMALEACATRQPVNWHQEHLSAIKKFNGKTIIPLNIIYGVYMTESAGTQNLGIPGRAITHANSIADGIGFLLMAEKIGDWRDWQDLPASANGAVGAMQFLPTTFLELIGEKVIILDTPLAKEGTEERNKALQFKLYDLKYDIDIDGAIGDKTRGVILEYLWDYHKFNPFHPDWNEWKKKKEYPTWRLARAARILILHQKYRKHMYLEKVGQNMAGKKLKKIDRRAGIQNMDPFVPVHAISAAIAYLELLQEGSPDGEDTLHFAVRAYNQGQRNAKKGESYGQKYLNKVLNAR